MTQNAPPRHLTWSDLPKEDGEVTFGTIHDDEGDYTAPLRIDYAATADRPARTFAIQGDHWIEVTSP